VWLFLGSLIFRAMKKTIKRFVLVLVFLITAATLGIYFWLRSSLPQYEGKQTIHVSKPVEVYFDSYGIPHIEAQNKRDAYKALGYVHAQERLFQMELLRRVGSGRLAEIIGPDVVKVDRVFRTLGVARYAKQCAEDLKNAGDTAILNEVQAYLDGVNEFIANGPTPPEFSLIGIEKSPLTLEDLFCITGAMSFGFSQANKTEPVVTKIAHQYGSEYLKDLGLWHSDSESFIPTTPNSDSSLMALTTFFNSAENALPIAPFNGSNAWAVTGAKTESGLPLFCNDTHIGYGLPQTWFEAHVKCPEFEIHGHFLGGIPYALVGKSPHHSWGLTMLLNDDMDFYFENFNPNNSEEVLYKNKYVPITHRQEIIHVKESKDIVLDVRETPHGPIVNEGIHGFESTRPIACKWEFTQKKNETVQAFRGFNQSISFEEFQTYLPLIHAPGLSVNYADNKNNIAWFACAHLIRRNKEVNSWMILDGKDTLNEWQGYYNFNMNPRTVNPEWGFIYSANDWPGQLADGTFYPGYYKPQYRGDRIKKLLSENKKYSADDMKRILNDVTMDVDAAMLKHLEKFVLQSAYYSDVKELFQWDGSYTPTSAEPVLFNRFLFNFLHLTCADEMGEETFNLFMETHQMQRAYSVLFYSENSPWFNKVNTPQEETHKQIMLEAFELTVQQLMKEEGDVKQWAWSNVCKLELKHPLGAVSLLKPFFNRKPMPVWGGNETIHQSGFVHKANGQYEVHFGSQMRIVVDYGSNKYWNVTPSGQSGHVLSPYFQDQAELYRTQGFREEIQDWNQIHQLKKLTLE